MNRPQPARAATPSPGAPLAPLRSLDTLWFQVAGTLCNLACTHCLVSSSPTNRTHEMLSLEAVRGHLAEGLRLGVREVYFTGGEPFLNPELEAMLDETLRHAPATVLTNGLLIDAARAGRLRRLADGSRYSLDLRVSLDGWDAASHDPIRGGGSFARALDGVRNLIAAGLEPVLTVSEVHEESASSAGRERYLALLRSLGSARPRLKLLPLFRIGAEAARGRPYDAWQSLAGESAIESFDHLQCSSSRMVTDLGVWVCPILVNVPEARMGERLADCLRPFPLAHAACWTCHVEGASCRT